VTGPLFGEAVGVLFVTCRALAYWIAAGAFAATVVALVGVAGAAWAMRRAWRGLYARLRPEVPAEAPRLLPTPERAGDARSANPSPHEAA
jgi:hypothetical protein